jgi:hypothetical protein
MCTGDAKRALVTVAFRSCTCNKGDTNGGSLRDFQGQLELSENMTISWAVSAGSWFGVVSIRARSVSGPIEVEVWCDNVVARLVKLVLITDGREVG